MLQLHVPKTHCVVFLNDKTHNMFTKSNRYLLALVYKFNSCKRSLHCNPTCMAHGQRRELYVEWFRSVVN